MSSRLGLLASWSRNHVIFIPDYLLTMWWHRYESVSEKLNKSAQYHVSKIWDNAESLLFWTTIKVLLCDYDIMLSVYSYVNQVDRWTLDEVI